MILLSEAPRMHIPVIIHIASWLIVLWAAFLGYWSFLAFKLNDVGQGVGVCVISFLTLAFAIAPYLVSRRL